MVYVKEMPTLEENMEINEGFPKLSSKNVSRPEAEVKCGKTTCIFICMVCAVWTVKVQYVQEDLFYQSSSGEIVMETLHVKGKSSQGWCSEAFQSCLPNHEQRWFMNNLLARRPSKSGTSLDGSTKVGSSIRVPVNLLGHGVSVAVASTGGNGSGMVHVPDFSTVGTVEESASICQYPGNQEGFMG